MDLFAKLLSALGLDVDEPKKARGKKKEKAGTKKDAPTDTPKEPAGPRAADVQMLEASDLLPITSEELKMSMRQLIRSGGWRFTGRGSIPLGDDRTRLINRAMLTQGLLTPEQLNQILQVAADYEQLQKAMVWLEPKAAKAGKNAQEDDKAERAKLKAKKKAEAAGKKRQYTDGVAHRRATDIIFLGPDGVSTWLNRRESNVEQLEALNLPVMHTPADVAKALGIEIPKLRWLAYHTQVAERIHYVHFEVPKKSGGTRILSAPHKTLAAAQKYILTEILNKLVVEEPAHGFVIGRSTLTNAMPHVHQDILVNLDLENFFPSISFKRVRSVFHRLGYSPAVATILALLCTECPRQAVTYAGKLYYVATGMRGLPQGACTSPALSNQVARKLDKRLQGVAHKLDLRYTRYADDVSFSGGETLTAKVGWLLAKVRHIAQDEGFVVNAKKTRVLRPNSRQIVTGIVVNEKVSVPRPMLKRLRAILHHAQTEGIEAQNREGLPHFRAWLQGMLAYVQMVRPELGAKLQSQYQQALKQP